jgi:hypothetical protein
MIRYFLGLALGLSCCLNVQGAAIASYNFNTNLNASSSQQGVGFTAGAFTSASLPGFVVRTPLVGVNNTGAAVFGATFNKNSFVNQATLTFQRNAGVTISSLNFDIRRSALFGTTNNGTLRISNNLNSRLYDLVISNSAFPNNQTILFDQPLTSNSITLTFSTKSAAGLPSFTPIIDNVNVNGVVPEPGTISVFAGLAAVGLAARRRTRKQ